MGQYTGALWGTEISASGSAASPHVALGEVPPESGAGKPQHHRGSGKSRLITLFLENPKHSCHKSESI